MKNLIFTFALLLVCFTQTEAQWGNNNYNYNSYQQPSLTVQNWDQSQIQILVDGSVQSNIGTSITINFDRPGNHHLSISKLVYNNIYRRYNNYQLVEIYNGNIYINDYGQYTALLDLYSQLNIQN
ncbi:MAG: hypothetical protein HYZ42_15150, partial [Bacteroidetes bacterium]|nr:hypothetical protein [Bacteroidota bacterium]